MLLVREKQGKEMGIFLLNWCEKLDFNENLVKSVNWLGNFNLAN
jgi:hypothetical protein